ncbi:hypothetical protein [Thiothrix subterranea]|uniref:hypothetical protein n=1 Tax=Thiothrix subterranea TaxID=2735563 RepID=UPI00280AA4C8|nr:hypothetical protein [Thiothrix subterranea]
MNWSFPKPVIAPANILLAVLLFIAVTQIISAYLLTQQQWTGIRVTATAADTLLIKSISANSPASGKLAAGETLLGLQVDGKLLTIKPLLNGYAPLSPRRSHNGRSFISNSKPYIKPLPNMLK